MLRRFENARQAIGTPFDILNQVVLRNASLLEYSRKRRIDRIAATGYVAATLDVLANHYKPPEPRP